MIGILALTVIVAVALYLVVLGAVALAVLPGLDSRAATAPDPPRLSAAQAAATALRQRCEIRQ